MNGRRILALLMLAVSLEPVALAPSFAKVSEGEQDKKKPVKEAGPRELKLTLTKVPVKKGSFRMGWGYKIEPPEEAWEAKLPKSPAATAGPDTLLFFDLSEGGTLEPGADGIALRGVPFIVPLPEKLLLRIGQYKVSFDGTKTVTLAAEDLGAAKGYVAEAALFTELRIRSGLAPVPLDAELTVACEKHTEYLKLNGLADGKGGMKVHQEEAGKPGYTEEGAAAGKMSDIGFASSVTQILEGCWATPWHGSPMVNPKLSAFGLAVKNGVSMIHLGKSDGWQDGINCHPPDGAVGVPRAFGERGEAPNPVPGTDYAKGCGFPVLIRLAAPYKELVSIDVVDAKGRKVAGTTSSPTKPANPEWPSNSNCAVFIPSKPLDPNTLYRAAFRFAEETEPVKWSFTTSNR